MVDWGPKSATSSHTRSDSVAVGMCADDYIYDLVGGQWIIVNVDLKSTRCENRGESVTHPPLKKKSKSVVNSSSWFSCVIQGYLPN